ncbi:hypothetical protein D3C73_798600 [compost metagenome]
MLEGAFVLQQRHVQVSTVEQQAALGCAKHHGAGEQQFIFGTVGRLGVAERHLFQTDALADQPTAEPMPDQQLAFGEEMVRVVELRVVETQADHFIFTGQGQARAAWE